MLAGCGTGPGSGVGLHQPAALLVPRPLPAEPFVGQATNAVPPGSAAGLAPKPADPAARPAPGEYRVHEGDTLRIQVSRESDLSGEFKVMAEGMILYPLLGKFQVGGLTATELEQALTKALGRDYLVRPQVAVQVQSSTTHRVVLLGEVKQPGVYELAAGQRQTLLQLIAKSGGFTDVAAIDRVCVVRKGKDGERTIKVKVSDLLRGEGGGDIELQADDVVTVPQSIF